MLLSLEGSHFSNNTGEILLRLINCNTTINNAQWSNNSIDGLALITGGTLNVSNSSFSSNVLGALGGLYLTNLLDVHIENSSISNTSMSIYTASAGSFIVAQDCNVVVSDCTFSENFGYRGGVAGFFACYVSIFNSLFV